MTENQAKPVEQDRHAKPDLLEHATTGAKTRGTAILRAVDVSKTYGEGDAAVHSLRSCSIELEPGTITVVVGPSGSGKSTLLHILSGLDTPTTGTVWLNGMSLSEMAEKERAHWRARDIGFVLQRDNLIPSLSIEENVAAPLILGGERRSDALDKARETLELVGLSHRAGAWPATVSGGEAQRAAVARACAGSPKLIFQMSQLVPSTQQRARQSWSFLYLSRDEPMPR